MADRRSRTTSFLDVLCGAVLCVLAPHRAAAVPLNGQPTGITGMNPRLVESRNGQGIYLFAASQSTSVLRFNTATLQWESGIPDVPNMADVDLKLMACYNGQCWGGPSYAVDHNEVIHVIWGELGWNDCDPEPSRQFSTSVRLIHSVYDGGWTQSTIIERTAGSVECGYQYPNVAEDAAGNLVLIYQHALYIDCPNPPNCNYQEGTHYHTRPSGGSWTYRGRIGTQKVGPRAAGGFGKLWVAYSDPGRGNVAQIDPITGTPGPDELMAPFQVAPNLLPSGGDDLHAFFATWTDDGGGWHAHRIYYNRRASGGWMHGDGLLLTEDESIFVSPADTPETLAEEDAVLGLAVTPSGDRLLTFSYARRLYAMKYDGSAWGPPVELETGDAVWSAETHAIGDDLYLLVWSTGRAGDAVVKWALMDVDPCAACAENEICQDEQCVCAADLCDGVCCGVGQVCLNNLCLQSETDGGTFPDAASMTDAGGLTDGRADGGVDVGGGCSCRHNPACGRWPLPVALLVMLFLARRRRSRGR